MRTRTRRTAKPSGRRCLYARDPVLDMVYEIKEINRYRDANGVLEEGKG